MLLNWWRRDVSSHMVALLTFLFYFSILNERSENDPIQNIGSAVIFLLIYRKKKNPTYSLVSLLSPFFYIEPLPA